MTTTEQQEMLPPPYPQHASPEVAKAIVKGVAYSTIGNALLRVFDVLTVIVLLRSLSVYDYGIYILSLATYSFWTMLFLPGLQNVIVSDAAAARKNNKAHARSLFSVYAYLLFSVCIALWAVFFFAGNHFAHVVDGKEKYLSLVSWLFLLSPFETLFGLKVAILLDFGWGFVYKLIKSFVRLGLLIVLLLFFSVGIGGAITSIIFSMAFALVVVWTLYRRTEWFTRVTFEDIRTFWSKALRTHGKWALAEDFFNSITQNIQPFLIKFFLGAEAVALVTLASNLISFAKTILPVRDVLFPTLPQTENKEQFALYAGKLMKYATLAYGAISLASAVGAPVVVHVLFPKYIPALPIFYIILLSLPMFGVRSVAVPIFFALKAQRSLFFIIVSRTLLLLVMLMVFMWLWGIIGVAISMMITAYVTAFSYLAEIKKRLPTIRLTVKEIFSYDEHDKKIVAAAMRYARQKLIPLAFQ